MTPVDPEAPRTAFRVLDALQDLDIPYHLGGSYASAIHGIPRQTHDVDLIVDLPPDRIPAREVFVKSAEDTVLRKLLWYRMGGEVSDRQWEDVRGIVAIQGERLDRGYLATWAEGLALGDLLQRLLADE